MLRHVEKLGFFSFVGFIQTSTRGNGVRSIHPAFSNSTLRVFLFDSGWGYRPRSAATVWGE